MCGRYRRTTSEEEIARRYNIPIPPELDLPISYNIAPSQQVLVIRQNSETKEPSFSSLKWGLVPNWAKDEKITTGASIPAIIAKAAEKTGRPRGDFEVEEISREQHEKLKQFLV